MKALISILTLGFITCFQTAARADVALEFGNYSLRIDQQTTFGWAFTISSPIYVTALGYFDFGNDGLTDSHQVAIWNSTGGSPLLMATVPAGTTGSLVDGSRYIAVTPILLPAGSYTIGGFSLNFTDSVAIECAIITPAPGITYDGARSAQGPSLMFPAGNTQGYQNGDFGPNFQFAVPEPSAYALLAAASVALAGRRAWRRRKINSRPR